MRASKSTDLARPLSQKQSRKRKLSTEKQISKEVVKSINWYIYQNLILLPLLLPFYDEIQLQRGSALLKEDADRPYTHHCPKESSEEQNVIREVWPSSSPDLDPLEIVWNHMNDSISTRDPNITKLKGLSPALSEVWRSISQQHINHSIESIPARLQACINDNGGNNSNP